MNSHTNPNTTPEVDRYNGEVRITADLDDARPFDVVRAWQVLKRAGAYDIEARVSAGGDGFHIRGFADSSLSDRSVMVLRHLAGDDPHRIKCDTTHDSKPTQILFTSKNGEQAGEWHGDPWLAVDDLFRRSPRFDPTGYRVDGRGWPR